MLEKIKSYCEHLDYCKGEGCWVASIAQNQNYLENLEIYIVGDVNELNPALEKAAIRVLNNFRAVESTVKAYLVQIKSTTFKAAAKDVVIQLNDCPNTESLWKIMWLNFLDADKLDRYEVVCSANPDFSAEYNYCLWVVTLRNDTPISHHGEFW